MDASVGMFRRAMYRQRSIERDRTDVAEDRVVCLGDDNPSSSMRDRRAIDQGKERADIENGPPRTQIALDPFDFLAPGSDGDDQHACPCRIEIVGGADDLERRADLFHQQSPSGADPEDPYDQAGTHRFRSH